MLFVQHIVWWMHSKRGPTGYSELWSGWSWRVEEEGNENLKRSPYVVACVSSHSIVQNLGGQFLLLTAFPLRPENLCKDWGYKTMWKYADIEAWVGFQRERDRDAGFLKVQRQESRTQGQPQAKTARAECILWTVVRFELPSCFPPPTRCLRPLCSQLQNIFKSVFLEWSTGVAHLHLSSIPH